MTIETEDRADRAAGPAPHSTDHRIRSAKSDGDAARVDWTDGRVSRFHWIWLRDNCHCPDCVHPITLERTVDILSWPEDIRPDALSLDEDGGLTIVWPDGGHVSRFTAHWLRANCYSDAARAERRRAPVLWSGDLGGDLPTITHAEIFDDDAGALRWLHHLHRYGIALVRGVPCEEGEVRNLAERIGPVRGTNFGEVFDVVSMKAPNSNAYTALSLPLHNDLPYREQEPGYQFLHCLRNEATGGESLLADGYQLARALRDEDPDGFDTLCSVPFSFGFVDSEVDYRQRVPVIGLDDCGEVGEIRFSPATATPLDIPGDRMRAAYSAWRRFAALTRDPQYQLRLRLEPGDTISFDNRRVLHARTTFDPASGHRHLQGCYVEREDAECRVRVLERTAPAGSA